MVIHVGCSDISPPRDRYLAAFRAMEILPSQEVPPKASVAGRWAKEVPDDFCFTMVASRLLSTTPTQLPPGLEGDPARYGGLQLTDEVRGLYDRTAEAALALGARALVFVTAPQLRPGPRGREVLRKFFSTVDRGGLRFAWEPHGPWADREIQTLCAELDLIRCVDPLRDPLPEGARAAYARLGPFAVMGRSIADDELEDIVETLSSSDEAFCFLATEHAFADAKRLRELSLS